MSDYQVTYWREVPSLVVVRDGDQVTKTPLPPRFQNAVDEAAMRLGEIGSEAYLDGWSRGPWTPAEGTTAEVAEQVVRGLEDAWPKARLRDYLDDLRPSDPESTGEPA